MVFPFSVEEIMQSFFPNSYVRSIVRALVDSLIALYLPPGGGALLAQLAGALVHLPARGKALRR
jgi:hypothetical protein